ncbi:matrilin-2-like isoform X2 [Brienomyrus brachyistius]|uniref:matrilin-2-like isoform X2 n=1 Tax=Brienomyrus brachyistius TaxID=42636 RepID=UPI0020B3FC06|nr:matrilin-2-like isoform X2 [Brienomyrus brachyistius]
MGGAGAAGHTAREVKALSAAEPISQCDSPAGCVPGALRRHHWFWRWFLFFFKDTLGKMRVTLTCLLCFLCGHPAVTDPDSRHSHPAVNGKGNDTTLLESPCKGKPLDFVFIIDSSRSVRPHDYEKVKAFIKNILEFLDVGPEATRVGLLQYGSVVQNEFFLRDFQKKSDMQKAVDDMIQLASGTMTGLAIEFTMNVAFSEAEGARSPDTNVPRMAMVVTDGRPQDTVHEVAASARSAGIEIFAIGVGRVDMSTLLAIGSEPHAEHVFLVANFSQIETLTSVFQSKICGGAGLCSVVDHRCDHHCVGTPTSYMCRCRKGYVLNSDGKTCQVIDHCDQRNHGCEHDCVSTPDSYVCRCKKGFVLNADGKTCREVDFCTLGTHGCEHKCVNTEDSFLCQCQEGYTLKPDGKTCKRIDLCALGHHGCEHKCVNTGDSYECQCHKGYTLNPDGKTCRRIDLCVSGIHGCEHKCVNIEDSYECRCHKGYKLNLDEKTCRKIALCALGHHGCEHKCVNTGDSFVCQCHKGYTLNPDGKTCRRIDLCNLGHHGCEHKCVNTEDSFVCQCHKGYTLNPDGKTCRKIDLCALGHHGCAHECVNTDGSYECRCYTGYTLNADGKTCERPECGKMDLVFVIDGSKSLGLANFQLVKQFVNSIVDSLNVSRGHTQVGLLQYSTKVRTEFSLGQFSSAPAIKQAVSRMQYMARGSMTGSALRHMFEVSFSPERGARPSVHRVSIVFTDGRSQDDVSKWAAKAQESGIVMYAVGVGKAIEDELREIASEPDEKHLLYAKDFSRMDEITNKLKSHICEAVPKPPIEDLCRCENMISFRNQAAEQLNRLNLKLELLTKRLDTLENDLGDN